MSTEAIRARIARHVTEVRGVQATCVVLGGDGGFGACVCAGDWSLVRDGDTAIDALTRLEDALAIQEAERCGRANGQVATAAEFKGFAHDARV